MTRAGCSDRTHCKQNRIHKLHLYTAADIYLRFAKKRSEETQTLRAGYSKAEPRISPRRRPPFRGRMTAKIYSAGGGHYLYVQTQFGEDRCTVVTDPQTHTHTPIHPHTHTNRHDRLQYTAPLTIINCNVVNVKSRSFSIQFDSFEGRTVSLLLPSIPVRLIPCSWNFTLRVN